PHQAVSSRHRGLSGVAIAIGNSRSRRRQADWSSWGPLWGRMLRDPHPPETQQRYHPNQVIRGKFGANSEHIWQLATGAFSSEVETGSREENASKQESRAPFRFNRNGKGSRSDALSPTICRPLMSARHPGSIGCDWRYPRKGAYACMFRRNGPPASIIDKIRCHDRTDRGTRSRPHRPIRTEKQAS